PAAVADVDTPRRFVDAHVVSVAGKSDLTQRCEVLTAKQADRTISGVRHVDRVGNGLVSDALRLIKAAYGPGDPSCAQIQNLHAVIAEFRDIEALSRGI